MRRTFILKEERNAESLYAFLKANWRAMAEQGTPLAVEVSEYKEKRNNEQNKHYWKLLQFIAGNAWINGRRFDDEIWHQQFRRWFLGLVDLPDGKTVGISTTSLNVSEFAAYVKQIERYATEELGLALPANPKDLI
jgi:hypothetical protein